MPNCMKGDLVSDKPIIGISMRVGDNPKHESVDIRYVQCVEMAGGVPLALPYGFTAAKNVEDVLSCIDGLLLTGGGDIMPDTFGGHNYADHCVAKISLLSAERDVFEYAAAKLAYKLDMPTLGVCRGLQAMNVTHGGTLVRDISELDGEKINHVRLDIQDEPVHGVRVKEGSQLASILGKTELGVNSLHHLAICEVADKGEIVAWADDGTPEGLEFADKTYYLGVQWHPEIIRNTPSLFESFVEAARAFSASKR